MKLKKEFREDLEWLYSCIGGLLHNDDCNKAEYYANFFPSLMRVISYLWRNNTHHFLKK